MSEENKKDGRFSVDYSKQFGLPGSPLRGIETKIFDTVKSIAEQRHQNNMEPNNGLLILFGDFFRPFPHGRQFQTNPFGSKYITVADSDFRDRLIECIEKDYDGAVLIDRTGQLMGAKVYVEITNPDIDHDVKGTRHLAAVSGSTLEQVISTIALSQTSNKVTVYKNGKEDEVYDPAITKKDVSE